MCKKIQNLLEGFIWLIDNGRLMGNPNYSNYCLDPQAIQVYGLRWEIETLFGCLKDRGFKLEGTRVVGYLRIKKLLVLPVIAICWAHKIGEWKHDCVLPIKIKTHQRRAQSLF